MNLDYSEDQFTVARLVQDICRDHCGSDVVRAMENDPLGYPRELWRHLSEAGLSGVLIPEHFGGAGLSMLECAAIYEQFGRALAPLPHFVSSVVSALALANSSNESLQRQLLSPMAEGKTVVTPAWLEPDGSFGPAGVQLSAAERDGSFCLNGIKRHVSFASACDYFLVLARCNGTSEERGIDIFLVPRDSGGITLEKQQALAGDAQYKVTFEQVVISQESRLTEAGKAWPMWCEVINQAIILQAAYVAGLTERALEITVAYAKEREQFGKPIGAFQAIGHYLADCSTVVDGAKTLMYEAAWAHANGKAYRGLAAMASRFAGTTARDVTAKCEQIHGGIGFILDYDIQLYFRRAKQIQLSWWDTAELDRKIATYVLDSDSPLIEADPFV